MTRNAERFGELFESAEGNAINDMICDTCGTSISSGDECYACMLLPDKHHFNYSVQKPEGWAYQFIK